MSRPASTIPKIDTRERILDVALELFVAQGYDKTSLREIAEQLGVTKAALYYHFASKDDILLALHGRLHELLRETTEGLGEAGPWRPGAFANALRRLIGEVISNEKLFQLHERNRAAFEKLHQSEQHTAMHSDLEVRIRELLADTGLPVRTRVRTACALGAVTFGIMLPGDAFADIDRQVLAELLSEAIDDLLETD